MGALPNISANLSWVGWRRLAIPRKLLTSDDTWSPEKRPISAATITSGWLTIQTSAASPGSRAESDTCRADFPFQLMIVLPASLRERSLLARRRLLLPILAGQFNSVPDREAGQATYRGVLIENQRGRG